MITQKLKNLAFAISEFEGWAPDGGNTGTVGLGSRSYQNHNPGNLRRSPFGLGERDDFAYFLNDDVGLWALIWDLWKKCRGETRTGLTGESTIKDLIWVWTADPESVKIKYIEFIEHRISMGRDMKLKNLIN